ncbi:MAG: 16S rRNA (cytidine(1402)-2'-O)-methyltransferase [Actinobacteria bacterium]|nr:16S rRNA (cytidine(1402)-2'-O)-methyltransferase [Actinomycetota bacterium]NCU77975.1 16S rRNA (cytidine(1402)-2'-O)-methyltransferase [Actinomycetota bacterium]NCU96562.1 16S rRNA (cytidine(1402)-2'-O)-methyltransferase [Actinomycetota bacterium]NDD78497.1 16S rRNA (cytidine(1402)-2'-O)-methyltransferase [Actinomycetota bacterium]
MLILACLPIGDARDASAHLIQAITKAQFIAAEDSRKFSRLCQELNVKHNAKVISFFEGNESDRIQELTSLLTSNKDILVVTDAGAPGISDPGYRLIRAALNSNIQVKVLPGPSAVTTALLLSGLPTDRFCFEGFPPRTKGARTKWFKDLATEERTIVFFEAPHRIIESLLDAQSAFGSNRKSAICREMSKHYEEIVRGDISELVDWAKSKEILGEITVVVEGFDPGTREFSAEDLVKLVVEQEKAGESRKEAIAQVAKSNGVAKRVVFDAMVAYKSEDKI